MKVETNSLEEMAEEYYKLRKDGYAVTISKRGILNPKYILKTVNHPLSETFD